MRKLIIISLLMILSSLTLSAQEKTESPKDPQEKSIRTDKPKDDQDTQTPAQKLRGQKHKFIDENGDGVDDNAPNGRMRMRMGQKGNGKGMDNFVDKDGDGINDNRACGMGWQGQGRKGSLGRHGGGGGGGK
ncbi:MAG TPA: hypothetical protein VHO03_13980 [Ignavibacteriales bacterium]|nr:hypothetical protein [Ignavibacteriales bacterium]